MTGIWRRNILGGATAGSFMVAATSPESAESAQPRFGPGLPKTETFMPE